MFKRVTMIGLAIIVLAIGIAFYAVSDPDIPVAVLEARYGGPPSQFLVLPDGTRAHYRDRPGPVGAPTIVLLHGAGSWLGDWEPWAAEFAGKLRVVSVDLPGHGLTGATIDGDYSGNGMVAFLDNFTRKLAFEQPFVLAGNSMGGNVAWRFALAHPDRVSKLVLVDAGGLKPPGPDQPVPLVVRIERVPILGDILRFVSPRPVVESIVRGVFYDQSRVTPQMIDQYWQMIRRPGNRAANLALIRQGLDLDYEPGKRLGEIMQPVLILWGREDKSISVANAGLFTAALPDARAIVYEHCGHVPMLEVPTKSADDVLAFIGVPPKPISTGMGG